MKIVLLQSHMTMIIDDVFYRIEIHTFYIQFLYVINYKIKNLSTDFNNHKRFIQLNYKLLHTLNKKQK